MTAPGVLYASILMAQNFTIIEVFSVASLLLVSALSSHNEHETSRRLFVTRLLRSGVSFTCDVSIGCHDARKKMDTHWVRAGNA